MVFVRAGRDRGDLRTSLYQALTAVAAIAYALFAGRGKATPAGRDTHSSPATAKTVPMASDARIALAYNAATTRLAQQDATLGNLRNRATGLLSAAALVTSFSTGLGLIQANSSRGPSFPHWAAYALLGILVVIGCFSMYVLWPIRSWAFGPDAATILKKTHRGKSVDKISRYVTKRMVAAADENPAKLSKRQHAYRFAVLFLVAEVAVLVSALASE